MNSLYNGKLISNLSSGDKNLIQKTLEEIEENKNPVFLYPVYRGFDNYKTETFAHYFLKTLAEIDCKREELEKIIDDILLKNDIDFIIDKSRWILALFIKVGKYDDEGLLVANAIINKIIKEFEEEFEGEDFELIGVFKYLENFDLHKSKFIYEKFPRIFTNKYIDSDIIKKTIKLWLITDIDNNLQKLKNIIEIQKHNNVFLKALLYVLNDFSGPQITLINDKLKTFGEQYYLKISKFDLEKKLKELKTLQINLNGLNADRFGFPMIDFFGKEEKLCENIESLVLFLSNLRNEGQKFNKNFQKHGYLNEEIKKIIPNSVVLEHYNKPFNSVFLFLNKNNYIIDFDLGGLRDLNGFIGTIIHEEDEIMILEKLGNYLGIAINVEKIPDYQLLFLNKYIEGFKYLFSIINDNSKNKI